jgi:hypothetical protein
VLNREYARMVADVAPSADDDSASVVGSLRELRSESRTVVAILNMLFSIVGVFVAVFVASAAVLSDYSGVRAAACCCPPPHTHPSRPVRVGGGSGSCWRCWRR